MANVIDGITTDVSVEFDRVLRLALEKDASDIHYDPMDEKLVVRFRIDGFLFDIVEYPEDLARKITTQIKVAADMDIAERRLPQDGRIEKNMDELGIAHDSRLEDALEAKGIATKRKMNGIAHRKLSLRISSLPISNGEKIVLRILDTAKQLIPLEDLGFCHREFSIFNSLIRKANGLILVCGPTGSGKTTTLYSALNAINSRDKNIITIEDPVEYYLRGINQSPVHEAAGASFARILRSVLRQDPDVIMIGEIRDAETASIAVKASLTGHLVFSTVHACRSAAAISRLTDLGIERSLLSASLIMSIAQVLVRKICSNCKVQVDYGREAIEGYDSAGVIRPNQLPSFSYGTGCEICHNSGYKGRAALYELLEITEDIAAKIYAGAPEAEIEAFAVERGLRTLTDIGFLLVNKDITTPEEVLRVTTL